MVKLKYIFSALILFVLVFSVQASEKTLTEDIFPKTFKGLPLYSLEEEAPDQEIAEGFSAYYGSDISGEEIDVLLWRIKTEQTAKGVYAELLSGFKFEYDQLFDKVEWDKSQKTNVKGKEATFVTLKAYLMGGYVEAGIIFTRVEDYILIVQIVGSQGKPSLSEIKEVLGLFIDKIPGQGQQEEEEEEEEDSFPDLEISLSKKNINLELGGTATSEIIIKNIGKGRAEEVVFTIHIDRPEIVEASPLKKNAGAIGPGEQFSDYIGIVAKGSGKAYLAIHVRGSNASSSMKFIQVQVPESLALSTPESIFLLPKETNQISLFLINEGKDPVYVHKILAQSEDSSVVSVEEGMEMDVTGQGQGICCGRVISTESDDITNAIYPKPKIKAKSAGQTELVFKVLTEGKTIEKRVKVGVGEKIGGKNPSLDVELRPSALMVERDEARKVEVVLVNNGSEIIREGKIYLYPSSEAPFESTREINFGFVRPNKEAKAEIEIIGHPQFPSGLSGKDLAVTGTLKFEGQFTTLDGGNFEFEKEMKISLVEQRAKCSPQDKECRQTAECFVDLSNEMGCALEFADVIPYFDKPVAAVLATSDVCEIKSRVESGDAIGAAISALLMTVDLGDNVPDAVPGAGNVLSVLCDIVEGSADCVEGFIYDAVNDYCAGGQGGYSGCAEHLFGLIASESEKWKEPKSAKSSVVAIGGSPVSLSVVDDRGKALTLRDGVLVIEKEDLKLVFIKNPQNLKNGYNFKVQGLERGTYDLDIGLISEGRVVKRAEIKDQQIGLDQEVSIPVLVKEEKGELKDLFVGEEAEKQKKKEKASSLFLYLTIGISAVLIIAIIVVIIILVVKRKKK